MINFATATQAELEAAGYTVTVKRSQRRNKRRSALGVRPSCNNAGHVPTPAAQANQGYRGII